MLIQQIRNEMKMNGYTVPQKTRKSPFVIGGIRLTEDSLQSSMQTCFGGAEGVVCYPRVPPSSLLYIKMFPIWRQWKSHNSLEKCDQNHFFLKNYVILLI